ncbi:MAG: NADP-dependent oxidoreductase [Micrococcaceae bacterium]|nr:NADP-dependent oxidoreductase [Micrococcaceae bacterium]
MFSTQIHLVSRPQGAVSQDNFSTVEVRLPELRADEVRVRNEFISVDPYMRGRMNEGKSYIEPFKLNQVMDGGAVGRVMESTAEELPVGTLVQHMLGWRDVAQGPAKAFRAISEVSDSIPSSLYLGLLGMPGITAYTGLTRVGTLQEGDNVFVSGAAGAVGTAVGQFARLLGANKVYGSAGGPEKCQLLTRKYGFDEAIDYKAAPIRQQTNEIIGDDGADLYYDNVGGDHLEAAIDVLARFGRIVSCGVISQMNNDGTPQHGPDNMSNFVTQSLRMQGFTVGEHLTQVSSEFQQTAGQWFADGKLEYDETVVDGLDHAVEALQGLFESQNIGKMVVRI